MGCMTGRCVGLRWGVEIALVPSKALYKRNYAFQGIGPIEPSCLMGRRPSTPTVNQKMSENGGPGAASDSLIPSVRVDATNGPTCAG